MGRREREGDRGDFSTAPGEDDHRGSDREEQRRDRPVPRERRLRLRVERPTDLVEQSVLCSYQ